MKDTVSSINLEQLKSLTLDDVPYLKGLISKNISEVRITETIVHLYLFTDIMIIRETGFISKLVNKIWTYELQNAEVESSDGNSFPFD